MLALTHQLGFITPHFTETGHLHSNPGSTYKISHAFERPVDLVASATTGPAELESALKFSALLS